MHAVPGGPFDSEKPVPPAVVVNLEKKFELDRPLWQQYTGYVWGILRHFDFGPSYTSSSRTVNGIIRDHLPVSAQLAALAILIAVAVGLPVGAVAALNRDSYLDHGSMFLAVIALSVPSLALGPLLAWVFALELQILPVATWGTPAHMVLPALTLGIPLAAIVARLTRASLLEVLRQDFIRTAHAKGLAPRVIVLRHALRGALMPVITLLGPALALLISGTLVVERVFAVPGMGSYFVDSIGNRDYPVIMGMTLVLGGLVVAANLVVDVAHAFLDPRIKHG